MKELTFYRDKKETFKCNIHIDGASPKDTDIRLCIESKDLNMFFTGKIDTNGLCIINIPKLKDFPLDETNMYIEVIADSTYNKVFESKVTIKNSVSIKIETEEIEEPIKEDKKIEFSIIEEPVKKTKQNIKRSVKNENETDVFSFKSFMKNNNE